MNKVGKWVLVGIMAVILAGLVVVPAFAKPGSFRGMMGGSGGSMAQMQAAMGGRMAQMHGAMGGEMAEMHALMGPLMAEMPAMHDAVMGEVAGLLGTSVEALTAAMAGGKSLAEIAAEQNVAVEEIRAAMTGGMTNFLDRLVEEQKISPDEAGRLLGYMDQNADSCLTGAMGTGVMGGMHGVMGIR